MNMCASIDADFRSRVQTESGQDMAQCYQCGKCTAGCPYAFAYDISVSQMMRLVQSGRKEAALSAKSLWMCATCETCTTRCPNGIDVARVMDVLRHMSRREGFAAASAVKTFWDCFLDSVRNHGRVFELGLMAGYVARTGRFWTDMDLAPRMLPKGKMSFLPHAIVGKDEVQKIFMRFQERSRT